MYDKIRVGNLTPYHGQSYEIISRESPWSSNGFDHTLNLKEGYLPNTPANTLINFRNECVEILNFGIICDAHHHEVAIARQCEIDIRYDTLVNSVDSVQIYKYIVKNIAKQHNMVATIMPKPVALDNGSGLHVNISLGNNGKNLFFDENDNYAEISDITRYFCGGSWNIHCLHQ